MYINGGMHIVLVVCGTVTIVYRELYRCDYCITVYVYHMLV